MKPRIAFLVQGARGLYGAEKATLLLARGLAERGHAVRIWRLAETRDAETPDVAGAAFRDAGVDLRDVPIASRASPAVAETVGSEVEAWEADALVSTGYKADLHAWWASARGKRPFALAGIVHGWLFRGNFREWLYYRADLATLAKFDRVVVMSAFYERLLRGKGFEPLQLARIPTGIASFPDEEDVRALRSREGPFTFGVLGRLSGEKNPFLVLDAAARLARERGNDPTGWRVVFAGDGPLRRPLERAAAKKGLAGKVVFAGTVDANRFFRETHVLVQASNIENWPMSLLEAAAWGRPAIVTAAGGMPEIVTDGLSGQVVPRKDAKALAKAMDAYLAEPARARMDGRWARRHARETWPFPETLDAFEGFFATLPPRCH